MIAAFVEEHTTPLDVTIDADRRQMNNDKASVLYISYDGMLEPLGQSQVLAYLEQLACTRTIHLLSFEKRADWLDRKARARVRGRMEAAGIKWHVRRYHKRPSALATTWDILVGTFASLWLVLRYRLRIVHARSYVPALMALVVKRFTDARLLFDMRGFWADERVDGGWWSPDGRMYRVAKWCERQFLLHADHVVSLTNAGLEEIKRFEYLQERMPPVTVIPTCANLARFHPLLNRDQTSDFVLGYVGSVGTRYLFDQVVQAAKIMIDLEPSTRMVVITRSDQELAEGLLIKAGIPSDRIEVFAADHSKIAEHIQRMSAGIAFYIPSYSNVACAPTKLGEFLGCGVPFMGNRGVGDVATILEEERVGVTVQDFEQASLRAGLQQLVRLVEDPETKQRCVAAARKHFLLEEGVARYAAIYETLDEAMA